MHYAALADSGKRISIRDAGPLGTASGLRGSVMDYAVKEIAPQVWRVDVAGAVRIIRYRPDTMTFAPWDICTAEGRRLWSSPSLESAFRWIEARAGLPPDALLAEGLLQQTASNRALEPPRASDIAAEDKEPGADIAIPGAGGLRE